MTRPSLVWQYFAEDYEKLRELRLAQWKTDLNLHFRKMCT
jgi:hypothetical protein